MKSDLATPNGWELYNLKQLGEVNRGKSKHRPRDAGHLYGGIYPFIQTGDIRASEGRISVHKQTYSGAGLAQSRIWPTQTMCITIAANIAETGILSYPACFPDSVIGFIADSEKCNVYFIEYMFRLLKRNIQKRASGSVQDNINLKTLEKLYFPIPSLPNQNKISHILSTLDDKIELNRKMNKTLEETAQALFKSWFVDFDPVHAKANASSDADMEQIAKELGISKEVLNLFPSEFEESELGMIPWGWEVTKLGDCKLEIESGRRPKGGIDKSLNSGVPSVGAESISSPIGSYNFSTIKYVTHEFSSTAKKGWVIDRDVALYKDGGKPGLFMPRVALYGNKFPFDKFMVNEHVFLLRSKSLGQNYLYYLISSDNILNQLISKGSAKAAQPGLNQTEVKDSGFVLPVSKILDRFNLLIEPLINQQLLNGKQNLELQKTRDTLLPKLLSGELDVSELDLEGI